MKNTITSKNCKTQLCHVSINLKSYLIGSSYNDLRVKSILQIIFRLQRNIWLIDKELWDLWQSRKYQPYFKKK